MQFKSHLQRDAADDASPARLKSPSRRHGMPAMKAMTILLADDEESVCVLIGRWLQERGHTVTVVGNAIEGRRALALQTYDLVITDVLMPDGDGLNLIAEVKKTQPVARILAISGGGRYLHGEDYLKMARGLGARAIVAKPFTWQQLAAGIELALASATEQR